MRWAAITGQLSTASRAPLKHQARSFEIPLNTAPRPVLRFLQTAQLLLALSHFGTRESHSNDPTDAQEKGSRAGDNSRSADDTNREAGLIVSEIPARDHSPGCTRHPET
jgi:hypothetical protein